MKIGVYVGSFNPVHKGHKKIVNYLLDGVLDKVIVMPTEGYWNKTDLVDIKHRINMLKVYESDRVIIEKENNDLPCTYLVMEFLEKKYKGNEFYLILGADNITAFDKWEKYRELLEYNMVIVARDNIDIEYYLSKMKKESGYFIVDGLEDMDVSSTMIRNLIKINDFNGVRQLIDTEVLKYISENKLYME